MKPLGCLQQLSLAGRRGIEDVLGVGQLGGKPGNTHPQSIPEALAWLQGDARLH